MSFRRLSARVLEPLAMAAMVAGIVALCQPWSLFAHRYGITVILAGLAAFIVFSHVPRPPEED